MTPTEVELKLLLPGADARRIEDRLAALAELAGGERRTQWLWNRYYDSAEQALRRQRSALRLRCVADSAWPETGDLPAGVWIQTFKTAGSSQGGLSRRGEWEARVASGELDRAALSATPWRDADPDGQLFAQLQPCFDTRCRRTTWQVTHGGTRIEVALDVGEIVAGSLTQPLLELELELLEGEPQALFGLARAIGSQIALLPCDASKAERGYALAQGQPNPPARARATRLGARVDPVDAAQQAMGEMLEQLTRNLAGLCQGEDPELVHQARVAWRRWRSATRLFRPWLAELPERDALRPLLDALGALRDLDVARTETLPAWLNAYAQGDAARAELGRQALERLEQAGAERRSQARVQLAEPATGLALLGLAQWLHGLPARAAQAGPVSARRDWALARISKLQRRLRDALQACDAADVTPLQQHEARLLAKRARYGVETLLDLLPGRKARRWVRRSTEVQTRIGAERDLLRASELLGEIGLGSGLADFLRGVAARGRP